MKNMNKEIFFTCICSSLLLMTPLIAVAQENKISNNLAEKPDFEGLVLKIRIVINKIIHEYGHNQIVKNLCNKITGVLDKIGLFLFCAVFGLLVAIPLAILMLLLFFSGITSTYLGQVIFFTLFSIFFIWDYNCNFITFPVDIFSGLSSKSILSLTKIKNITKFSDDCPCLQE